MNDILHITRWRFLYQGGPTLCGTVTPRVNVVATYYRYKDRSEEDLQGSWCPECIGHLTPLEELAHTEL